MKPMMPSLASLASLVRACLLAGTACLASGQSMQSAFSEIIYNREKPPVTLHGGLDVESSTGSINLSYKLGPGIGARGAEFHPTLTGRFAPTGRLVTNRKKVYAPLPMWVTLTDWSLTSQDGFSLTAGELTLPLYPSGVHPFRTWNYLLPDGGSGALLRGTLPTGATYESVGAVYGYGASWTFNPVSDGTWSRLGEQGEMAFTLTDASHPAIQRPGVIGLDGHAIVLDGVRDNQPTPVPIPPIVVVIRGGAAYQFDLYEVAFKRRSVDPRENGTDYPSSLYTSEGQLLVWDMSAAQYRLTRITNRYQEHIDITYNDTFSTPRTAPDRSGAFTATWSVDPTLQVVCTGSDLQYNGLGSGGPFHYTLTTSATQAPRGPMDDTYNGSTSLTVSNADGSRYDDSLSRRAPRYLASVRLVDTGELLTFGYQIQQAPLPGINAFTANVLSSVTFPDHTVNLTWGSYTYRRNETDGVGDGLWQGYAGNYSALQLVDSTVHGAYLPSALGVTRIDDTDRITQQVRTTQHTRVVPIPDPDTPSSWLSTDFRDTVTHPDNTQTIITFVPPVNFPFTPGPNAFNKYGGTTDGSTLAEQMQTLAHLKHVVLSQQDPNGRVTVNDRWDIRGIGNPTGSFLGGSNPYPTRVQVSDPTTGARTCTESLDWDATNRGWNLQRVFTGDLLMSSGGYDYLSKAQQGATLSTDPNATTSVFRKETRHTFSSVPSQWVFGREDSSQVTLDDQSAGHEPSAPTPQTLPLATTTWDTSVPVRPTSKAVGPIVTSYAYVGTAGVGASQIQSIQMTGDGFAEPSVMGVSYDYDTTWGYLNRITPWNTATGGTWNFRQTTDGAGRPLTQTDANGLVTTIHWREAGRLDSVTPPGSEAVSSVSYDADYQGVTLVHGSGTSAQQTLLRYNGFGELVREARLGPDGSSWSHRIISYDLGGRKRWETVWMAGQGTDSEWAQATPPTGVGATLYEYDGYQRLTQVTDPNGVVTKTIYDLGGVLGSNPTVTQTQVGTLPVTTYTHDLLGRVVRVVDALGNPTNYYYDPAGHRLRSVQQDGTASSQTRTWTFNEFGWMTSQNYPESGTTAMEGFTFTGKPTRTIFGQNVAGQSRTIEARYDNLMRLVALTATDGTVAQAYGYDDAGNGHGAGLGKKVWDQDGGVQRAYAYDTTTGRLVTMTTSHEEFSSPLVQRFLYDGFGRRTSASVDGRAATTTYNAATGLPATVSYGGNVVAAATNDPVSWSLLNVAFANVSTLKTDYTYYPDQRRLKSMAHGGPAAVTWNFSYDLAGRLTTDGEDAYTYDNLNRLLTASIKRTGGFLTQSFSYDGYGNLFQLQNTGVTTNMTGGFTLNAAGFVGNRLPTGPITQATYDAQGNLTQVAVQPGGTRLATMTYDALGRVTAMGDSGRGVVERYQYNADGLRTLVETWSGGLNPVLQTRTVNLYNDGHQLVSQYTDVLRGGNTASGTSQSLAAQGAQVMALAGLPSSRATIIAPAAGTSAQAGTVVSFSGTALVSAEDCTWNFGDGSITTGYTATHTYLAAGTYTVTFSAMADGGYASSRTTVSLSITIAPPIISPIGATSLVIPVGGSSTLTWAVSGATSVTLQQGTAAPTTISATGSLLVMPRVTTVYLVTATNSAGTTQQSVTVTVVQAPVITAFGASPARVARGASTTLTWTVAGATGTTLNGAAITNNFAVMTPGCTTVYTLRATNTMAPVSVSVTKQVTVTVTQGSAPAIASFTATPAILARGGSTILAWTVTSATGVTLNGTPVTGTSLRVSPSSTTTYVLSATNASGTVSTALTVTVLPVPTITSFVADQCGIAPGQSTVLRWLADGATSVTVTGVSGTVGNPGSLVVTPSSTRTYTLTATNDAGSTSATVTVTVAATPVIQDFHATPLTVTSGRSTTLSWVVSGSPSLTVNGTPVTGTSLVVTPTQTTTYTLQAGTVSQSVTVTVTAGGNLTWKKDVVYMGAMEVAEIDASQALHVVQVDHLGSPRTMIRVSGGVATLEAKQKFTPFGEFIQEPDTVLPSGFAKGFTGHEQTDPTGMIYMQGRFYLPSMGRFLTPDPAQDQHPELTQTWNLYAYVQNCPTMRVDPTGLVDPKNPPPKPGDNPNKPQKPSDKKQNGDKKDSSDDTETINYDNSEDRKNVSEKSASIIKELMQEAGAKITIVTDTVRTNAEQARIMYKNAKADLAKQKSLYGKDGKAVLEVFSNLTAEKKSEEEIIAGMTAKIEEIKKENPGAFKHTGDPSVVNVIDISPTRITPKSAAEKFIEAIKRSTKIDKFFLPPNDPAIHIEIKQ